ncbi:MAG TPA: hypothetical protein VIC07_07065 [Acidimicrobiia bacterium]|jgi:hypothetical protein
MAMRFSTMLREAIAGVRSGTSRAGIIFVALVVTCIAYLALDGADLVRIESRYLAFTEQGGTTFQATAPGEINGVTCEDLNAASGVSAASALRFDHRVLPAVLPGTPFDVVSVSPSFVDQLSSLNTEGSGLREGVLVDKALAERFGVGVGDRVPTTTGTDLLVAGVFQLGWEDPILVNAFIEIVSPIEPFDRCLVRMSSPGVDGSFLAILPAAGRDGPTISTLNPGLGDPPDFLELVTSRTASFLRFLPAALGLAISLAIMARRSLEMSVMVNFGVNRRDIIGTSMLENLLMVPLIVLTVVGPWWSLRSLLQTDGFRAFFDAEMLRTLALSVVGITLGPLLAAPMIARSRFLRAFRLR